MPNHPPVLTCELHPDIVDAHEILDRVSLMHPRVHSAVETLRQQVRLSGAGSSLALVMAIPDVARHKLLDHRHNPHDGSVQSAVQSAVNRLHDTAEAARRAEHTAQLNLLRCSDELGQLRIHAEFLRADLLVAKARAKGLLVALIAATTGLAVCLWLLTA